MTAIAEAPITVTESSPAQVDELGSGSKIVYLDGASTVLKVARRMHDRVCRSGQGCPARDVHALDCFGPQVERVLEDLAAVADYAF